MNLLYILHRPFLHIDQRCILSVHGYGRHAYMHTSISRVCTTDISCMYTIHRLFLHMDKGGIFSKHGHGPLISFILSHISTVFVFLACILHRLFLYMEGDASPLYLGKVYYLSILFQHCRYIFHTVNRSFLNMNEGYVFTEHGIHISLFYAYCKCLL